MLKHFFDILVVFFPPGPSSPELSSQEPFAVEIMSDCRMFWSTWAELLCLQSNALYACCPTDVAHAESPQTFS